MLQPEVLMESVGASLRNYRGTKLGVIVEIKRNTSDQRIEYIVLESNVMFGRGYRYFAIPASPMLLKITGNGKIVLQVSKDDLQFAEGISADECPKPNLNSKKHIFELYEYGKISLEEKELK